MFKVWSITGDYLSTKICPTWSLKLINVVHLTTLRSLATSLVTKYFELLKTFESPISNHFILDKGYRELFRLKLVTK